MLNLIPVDTLKIQADGSVTCGFDSQYSPLFQKQNYEIEEYLDILDKMEDRDQL